jgi:hypothetical protein
MGVNGHANQTSLDITPDIDSRSALQGISDQPYYCLTTEQVVSTFDTGK